MATERTEEQRAAIGALKAERELDKAAAMREYQAERLHVQANFARLRALRLAREMRGDVAPAEKPVTQAKKKPTSPRTAAAKPARRKTPALKPVGS